MQFQGRIVNSIVNVNIFLTKKESQLKLSFFSGENCGLRLKDRFDELSAAGGLGEAAIVVNSLEKSLSRINC
jgi:hypothetical protein